jgi:hypothetical protein
MVKKAMMTTMRTRMFSSADYYVELSQRGIIVILGHVAIIVSCLNSVVWML